MVLQRQVVQHGGAALDHEAAAIRHLHVVQDGLGAVGAAGEAPLAPVARFRAGGVRRDDDRAAGGADGLQGALLEREAGARSHAYLHAGLDGEGGVVVEDDVALQYVGRLAGGPSGVGDDGAGDAGGLGCAQQRQQHPGQQAAGQARNLSRRAGQHSLDEGQEVAHGSRGRLHGKSLYMPHKRGNGRPAWAARVFCCSR